jgi:Protein of unknown function (DUF3995)
MQTTLIIINTAIFVVLSALHFYWAAGGTKFSESAIPTNTNGNLIFRPSPLATIIVAIGLLGFGLVMLANLGIFLTWLSPKIVRIATWAIIAIFGLRAMGDFRYVGFFKKIKNTTFAKNDTKIYSPLCLIISTLSFLIITFCI